MANYYGKDLFTPSAPPLAAPEKETAMDVEIGKAQWAWARQLGQEWIETEAAGKVFKLYPDKGGELVCCIAPLFFSGTYYPASGSLLSHHLILTHLLIFTLCRTFPSLGPYYATQTAISKSAYPHFLSNH